MFRPTLEYAERKVNLNEEVADSSETIGETGLLLAKPVVVGDTAVVDLLHELGVLSLHQHGVQPLAPALLHPLEAELEVDRQLQPDLAVALQSVDPAQNGTLTGNNMW